LASIKMTSSAHPAPTIFSRPRPSLPTNSSLKAPASPTPNSPATRGCKIEMVGQPSRLLWQTGFQPVDRPETCLLRSFGAAAEGAGRGTRGACAPLTRFAPHNWRAVATSAPGSACERRELTRTKQEIYLPIIRVNSRGGFGFGTEWVADA